jgi:hypothetical protein
MLSVVVAQCFSTSVCAFAESVDAQVSPVSNNTWRWSVLGILGLFRSFIHIFFDVARLARSAVVCAGFFTDAHAREEVSRLYHAFPDMFLTGAP